MRKDGVSFGLVRFEPSQTTHNTAATALKTKWIDEMRSVGSGSDAAAAPSAVANTDKILNQLLGALRQRDGNGGDGRGGGLVILVQY